MEKIKTGEKFSVNKDAPSSGDTPEEPWCNFRFRGIVFRVVMCFRHKLMLFIQGCLIKFRMSNHYSLYLRSVHISFRSLTDQLGDERTRSLWEFHLEWALWLVLNRLTSINLVSHSFSKLQYRCLSEPRLFSIRIHISKTGALQRWWS